MEDKTRLLSAYFNPLELELPQPAPRVRRDGGKLIGRIGSLGLSLFLPYARGHGRLVLLFLVLIVFLIAGAAAGTALPLTHTLESRFSLFPI